MMRSMSVWALGLVLAVGAAASQGQPAQFENFVTRRGDQLYDGDRPLRFVSFNIPNLLVIEDAFEFLGDSPWRWPDAFEIGDAFESVRQMNGNVTRSYVISVRRDGADMGATVHVLAPGQFNEEAFAALDLVLKIANEKGVRLIIPLVDNWKWMGGAGQYAAFRGKAEKDFWVDRQLIDDFKQTVNYVVNRRNTLTGQLYRDDKAILGWETGNELDAPPAWTAEIAAYLKQLDANHLVIDGRSLHGVPTESLADPHVDVVTTHHYPAAGVDLVDQITKAAQLAKGRKPYFVGEVGFIPVAEARRALDVVADSQIVGALYWSLRFHRREGGFYWHSEPNGENLFKAYHWPGFATGDDYDERDLLALVTEYAQRVSGATASDEIVLEPPRLLPIEHPGRISWQGSTGATGYDVERAENAAGPWTVVGQAVDDSATQYRPLFCDTTFVPGAPHYYRVTARSHGGATAASNVVGPVTAGDRLLVDEQGDDSQIAGSEGATRRLTSDTRRVQEDAHRRELSAGAALTYELPGDVTSVNVWVFTSAPTPPSCQLSTSSNGEAFVPLPTQARTSDRTEGDYGYQRPVLLQATVDEPGQRVVRIANAAQRGDSAVADGAPHEPAFEVSRIEITYDAR